MGDRRPRQLLGAIRYSTDAVVLQSVKYREVFVARTDAGGLLSAAAWESEDSCAWRGSRLRLQPVVAAGGASGGTPSSAELVYFGDEVSLVTADVDALPVCQCASSGVLCARPESEEWSLARFRIDDAAGTGDTAQPVCSWDDLRLSSLAGQYLRAASVAAEVADAACSGAGERAAQHTEAVVAACHARFSTVQTAAKVLGRPSVHVLRCVAGRDQEREVLCLVVASDAASAAARNSRQRYHVEGHSLEQDGWAASAGACVLSQTCRRASCA